MNIRDIAKLAGVSSTTVSRVINKSSYVKKQTRELVEQLIKDYNYTPSAVARSLSKQDTASIGVIIPDIENVFFSGVIRGISTLAEQNNFNIFYFNTNETPDIEHAALKTVKEQRLKGIIITPISNLDAVTREYLLDLENFNVPVVLIDRDLNDSNFDGVFIDNFRGAYEAVDALCSAGHQRIAIIAGPETSRPGRDRLDGYLSAMADNRLEIRNEYITSGDFKVDKGYSLTQQLLSMEQPPTAIFSSNNSMTLGCLKYLVEHGLKIGEDISLVGFDDIDVLNYIGFPISVVQRAVSEMGAAAMSILLDRLHIPKGEGSSNRIVYPVKLVLRGSEKIKI